MKKYITLAALLAAGTTFANADPEVYSTPWPGTGDGYTRGGMNAQEINLAGFSLSAEEYYIGDITFAKNTYTASFASYLAIVDLSSNLLLGISNEVSSLTGQSFGNASGKAAAAYSFSNLTLSADSSYLAVFLSGTTSLAVGSEFDFTSDLITTVTSDKNGIYCTALDSNKNSYGYAKSISDEGVISNFTDSSLTYGATYKVSVTPVPEPSAFGMLAGLGALALVASRRRRK
ncbi:MAG: PEP-CTERM sorting domain-containing protein [Verrucomicrobia bacterium]|nr:PEP-CTERM sorting domain-containing protein [Verrucomicrobiota bacterium]